MRGNEKESKESVDDLVSSFTSNLASYFGGNVSANGTSTKEVIPLKYNPNVDALEEDQRSVLRSKAIEEANAVLGTHEYVRDQYLENFNLLGVVTSPKLWDSNTLSYHQSNGSARASGGGESHVNNSYNAPSVSESIFDTVNAMSESISKEIESLNTTLYAYSKTYLGGDYYPSSSNSNNNDISSSTNAHVSGNIYDLETYLGDSIHNATITTSSANVMAILPQLENIDLTPIEAYLRKSGHLLEHFETYQEEDVSSRKDSQQRDINIHSKLHLHDPIQDVPEIFFNPYFDLTDSKTFESLLLLHNTDDLDQSSPQRLKSTTVDISEWQIPKTTTLTQHLDNIELELLNQVRSKSESFFRETNRFSYLKSLVADSVQEVIALRQELDLIRDKSVVSTELVPIMDRQRNDAHVLSHILEEILKVVEVKSSVGGLIAKGDYLSAVHAIQLGRKLLNGKYIVPHCLYYSRHHFYSFSHLHFSGECGVNSKTTFPLNKLIAFNKINDQLAQYENIVVMDLSNDLVEIFCVWDTGSRGFNDDILYSSGEMNADTQRAKVKQTILALNTLNKMSKMAEIYREKLCNTIRVTIRTAVAECAADADKILLPLSSATIVSMPGTQEDESENTLEPAKTSIMDNVKGMNFQQFMECLDLIFENIISLLQSAAGVNKFCIEEGINFKDTDESEDTVSEADSLSSSSQSALLAGAELSHKSISEILRLRKDAHSLVNFEEIKRLWDSCLAFTLQVETITGQKAYVLRSALLAQAKAYIERKHESNMSSLAAALDSERWVQYDVSSERQSSLDRLCSGRAVLASKESIVGISEKENSKRTYFAEVEGKKYRVVWSCLLVIEMIMSDLACAAHFQTLATNVVGKVCELLRLFNSRSTALVLEAGAIQSSARLKSINAKHLALVTQCVGIIRSILPHVRAALMAQLPSKQHTLLLDLDKIKQEYADHHDKVLNKFVNILGGIVDHNLAPSIAGTDFDIRYKPSREDNVNIECCPFLEGVITNTRKMHQVLVALLPLEDLMDVFSRIFSHLDSQVPKLFFSADSDDKISFSLPVTKEGKQQMILEVQSMARTLNGLINVRPWDFGATQFIARRLEVEITLAGSPESIISVTINGDADDISMNKEPMQDSNVNDGVDAAQSGTFENKAILEQTFVEDVGCVNQDETIGTDQNTRRMFPKEDLFRNVEDTTVLLSSDGTKSEENKKESIVDNSSEQTTIYSEIDQEDKIIIADDETKVLG
jgi:vacuolar protein sorting-associated protein 54